MRLMQAVIGRVPGGLAMAAIGACVFFTALTGASGVTIVALGSLLYPALRRYGYREPFTLGLLTSSGSLGLLFPPSLPIILYGVVSRLDIGQIFKAALIPGVLLVAALCVYVYLHQRLNPLTDRTPGSRTGPDEGRVRLGPALREAIWDWPIIVLLIVGIYGGFVTIAEVSAVIVAYVIVVACFVLKEVHVVRRLPAIMVEGAILSGAIIVILGMALGLTGYLVDEQIPNRILEQLTQLTENRWVFLAGLNLFLLAVGCVMDIFSAIIIVVPVIVPIALQYGIDPIHLGVIFLVNLEIGYSTPPVGINLFISSLKFEKPITLLYRASVPYLAILLALLIVITYIPALSLWLVD
jgi:tripartite ATP-independent transporter DctM subunit